MERQEQHAAECSSRVDMTINRPREEVYRFWRALPRLPEVMAHVRAVEVREAKRSRWVADGPFGVPLRWDAVIDDEQEGVLIAWHAEGRGMLRHRGSVRFADAEGGRSTQVTVSLAYPRQGGRLGAALGALLSIGIKARITHDLHRLRAVLEAGEAPTTSGQPAGKRSLLVGSLVNRLARR
jgi:uncharacterized membrane protein